MIIKKYDGSTELKEQIPQKGKKEFLISEIKIIKMHLNKYEKHFFIVF